MYTHRSASPSSPMREHPDRAAVLGELHARPFVPVPLPSRIYHFAFLVNADEARADLVSLGELCAREGIARPREDETFLRLDLGRWSLRWERHTEFTTYTWSTSEAADPPFQRNDPVGDRELQFVPPGRLLAAVHLGLASQEREELRLGERQHRSMLCVVRVAEGNAKLATEFKPDQHGFVRFLIEPRDLTPTRAGRLVQRVLELETYRTLALLGLPEARRIGPELAALEGELNTITQALGTAQATQESHALLDRLTALAARLEAQTASTSFRFGATRAYHGLVNARITAIGERRESEHVTVSAFLSRRFGPAMDTCLAVEARQGRLAAQLARAADLLRTRIQFELEQQNRALLQSMNRRAQLQLRLQETVEGLSVAAISYYVVGLVGYLAKAAKEAGLLPRWLTPDILMGLSVPAVIVGIWLILRRARASWARLRREGEREP